MPFPSVVEWQDYADAIRFSPHAKLVAALQHNNVPLSQFSRHHRDAGYYELHAKESTRFFKEIKALQDSGVDITFSKKVLQLALYSLEIHKYITPSESQSVQEGIRTGITSDITLEQYEKESRKSNDVSKFLSLAYYHLDLEDGNPLHWLWQAQASQNTSIGTMIDLDAFMLKVTKVQEPGIFYRHAKAIAEAVSRSSSVTIVNLDTDADYHEMIVENIASMLAASASIKKVLLQPDPLSKRTRINAETVRPLAEALKKNTSTEVLGLAGQTFGDEGVVQIVDAILSNLNSNIKNINFAACDIGNRGAQKILELLKKRKDITDVNVAGNCNIDRSLENEIKQICDNRNKKNNEQVNACADQLESLHFDSPCPSPIDMDLTGINEALTDRADSDYQNVLTTGTTQVTEMVTLKDGYKVPQTVIRSTMMNLEIAQSKSPVALYDLVKKCQNVNYKFAANPFGDSKAILTTYKLIDEKEQVHDITKHIVLSAVEGDGLSMTLRNPRKA